MTRELVLFRETHVTTRAAAAKRLYALAEKIEAMKFTLGDHAITLPEKVRLNMEYDVEDYYDDDEAVTEGELEFEIHWSPWEKMGASGMIS